MSKDYIRSQFPEIKPAFIGDRQVTKGYPAMEGGIIDTTDQRKKKLKKLIFDNKQAEISFGTTNPDDIKKDIELVKKIHAELGGKFNYADTDYLYSLEEAGREGDDATPETYRISGLTLALSRYNRDAKQYEKEENNRIKKLTKENTIKRRKKNLRESYSTLPSMMRG